MPGFAFEKLYCMRLLRRRMSFGLLEDGMANEGDRLESASLDNFLLSTV